MARYYGSSTDDVGLAFPTVSRIVALIYGVPISMKYT